MTEAPEDEGHAPIQPSPIQLKGFDDGDQETFFQKLDSLKSNTVFLRLAVSLSGLFFVVTGI